MIILVTTCSHRSTHHAISKALPFVRQEVYPLLFARRSFPRATYIFSDFDRLNFWQLECAAHLYRQLSAAGCRVLNDPACALQRLPLLRRLHRSGINSFSAWPADEPEAVDRFPVFIRTKSAHRGNLTDLLGDSQAMHAELSRLVAAGYPVNDLIIVEYRAEPVVNEVFRKYSVYRLGNRYVAAPSVHERNWTAKMGEDGVAGAEGYAEDLITVRTNPHKETLQRAFEIAAIDYGRADFGLVDGRPEIYEINTNPMMHAAGSHPFADRAEALQISAEALHAGLQDLDTVSGGPKIRIAPPPLLSKKGRRYSLFPGYLWLP